MKKFEQAESYQYYGDDVFDKKRRRIRHDRVRKHKYHGYVKMAQRRLMRHLASRDPENAPTRIGYRGWEF